MEGIIARAAKENIEVSYTRGYESPAVAEQDLKGAKRPEQKTINTDSLLQVAISEARKADVVVFVGGLNKNEKQDY